MFSLARPADEFPGLLDVVALGPCSADREADRERVVQARVGEVGRILRILDRHFCRPAFTHP